MRSPLLASLVALALCSPSQARVVPEYRGYIIKLKRAADAPSATQALESAGVSISAEIPQLGLVISQTSPESLTTAALSQIEYIEPNYLVRAVGMQRRDDFAQVLEASSWGMDSIRAPQAWAITKGSKNVVAAISDTGIWRIHPDLSENLWNNPGETGLDAEGRDRATNRIDDDGNGFIDDVMGWNFETNNNHPNDDHYHGTHVSGTIGAVGGNKTGVTGVAWKASLMALKFLDSNGWGTTEGGIRTILYAADNGAKVVNCSWGGDAYTQSLRDAIEYAKSRGTLVVAAAGNEGTDNDREPAYPASYDNENLISVAALARGKKPALTYFSNYGRESVDIAAPGEDILSTYNPLQSPVRREWYYELSGTSMAAPHISGAIVLLYSLRPDLTWWEAKEILLSTARPVTTLQGKVRTGGTLDVEAALKKAALVL